METTVEIRYAGVLVGRSTGVRAQDDAGATIGFAEPLPVGTLLTLKIGDSVKDARVEEVIESSDQASAGMRVRFVAAGPQQTGSNSSGKSDGVPESMGEEASESVANGSGVHQSEAGGGGGRRRRRRR